MSAVIVIMRPMKTDDGNDRLAIVVGASGGIGKEIEHELRRDSRYATVLGLSRSSEPPLDLEIEVTVRRWATIIKKEGSPGLIIDATGFLHGHGFRPEKSLGDLDIDHLRHAFAINAFGPALLMKHFLPLFSKDAPCVFATLSAKVGSIEDNRLGGWYSYRSSKAALNQFVRTASIELRRTHPNAICVAVHPGTVDTVLSKPFAKSGLDTRSPRQAAAEIVQILRDLEVSDSGHFIDYKGSKIPW